MTSLTIRTWPALFCVILLLGFNRAQAGDRSIPLFDGRSLDGWTNASGEPVTAGWVAEDGVLVRNRKGGSIFTANEYGDFDLSFQWKIAAKGNSGVKYRVVYYKKGVHGWPGWLGCEYQLFDDVGREAEPVYSTGSIYGLYAPSADKLLRSIDEFNDSRIVVRGAKIEHWLNGTQIVSADSSSDDWKKRIAASKFSVVDGFFENRKGRIELQDHGHKVWFRNIILTPLESN